MTDMPTLEATPADATFTGPFTKATKSEHVLKNPSKDTRLVIKVKTSDNVLFRLKPVFGFVEPGKTLNVTVVCGIFQYDATRKYNHRMVIQYTADKDSKTPQDAFKIAKRFKELRMNVVFVPGASPEAKKPDVPAEKKPEAPAEKKPEAPAEKKADAPAPEEKKADSPPPAVEKKVDAPEEKKADAAPAPEEKKADTAPAPEEKKVETPEVKKPEEKKPEEKKVEEKKAEEKPAA